jgi:hypothetical protein
MSNKNKTETSLEGVSELLGYVAEDRAESAGGTTVFKDSMEGRMHLLLDVLLTDSWDLALVKVALATQEARPGRLAGNTSKHWLGRSWLIWLLR